MKPNKQVPTLEEAISQFRSNIEIKRWKLSTLDDEALLTGYSNIQPHIQRLHDMKQEWRRERVAIPELWAPSDSSIVMQDSLTAAYNMSLFTAPFRSAIDRLSEEELDERHSTFSTKPDFGLMTTRTKGLDSGYPIEIQMSYDSWIVYSTCSTNSASLMFYNGGERAARYAISGMFSGIPGCWLAQSPQVQVPSSLLPSNSPSRDMDFAVLVNPIGSSSPENRQRDMGLGISFMRPALLIAMKGPHSWASSSLHPPDDSMSTRNDLALHAQLNLDILQMTWRIQHEETRPIPPIPDYGIIFGVVYDSECVQLVAHVALPLEENAEVSDYVSILVDTLEFPSSKDPASKDFRAWSLNRIRLVLALLTIQRNLFRLSALWDDVRFPSNIISASRRLDEAALGPAPSIRNCGSTWSQLESGAEERWFADKEYYYFIEGDAEDIAPPPLLSPARLGRIEIWRANVFFDADIKLVDEGVVDVIKL